MEVADREEAGLAQITLESTASQTEITNEDVPLNHKCVVREIEKIVEVPIEIISQGQPLSPRMIARPMPVELQVMRVVQRPEPVD